MEQSPVLLPGISGHLPQATPCQSNKHDDIQSQPLLPQKDRSRERKSSAGARYCLGVSTGLDAAPARSLGRGLGHSWCVHQRRAGRCWFCNPARFDVLGLLVHLDFLLANLLSKDFEFKSRSYRWDSWPRCGRLVALIVPVLHLKKALRLYPGCVMPQGMTHACLGVVRMGRPRVVGGTNPLKVDLSACWASWADAVLRQDALDLLGVYDRGFVYPIFARHVFCEPAFIRYCGPKPQNTWLKPGSFQWQQEPLPQLLRPGFLPEWNRERM